MRYERGQVFEAEIIRMLPFGVHVKFDGGTRGFVRKRDLIYSRRIFDLENLFKLNQKIMTTIIEVSGENNAFIYLEHKSFTGNPWSDLENRIKEGDIAEGVVVGESESNFYVEILPGVDGSFYKTEFIDEIAGGFVLMPLVGDRIKVKINYILKKPILF